MQLRKILRPLVIACSLTAAATSQAACPFNVAGTGAIGNAASYDALRDGVLITRYAQGLRGATLVAGTGATPATVEANITANLVSLDINGDGLLDVQDAIVINRALFGLAPDKLGSGVTNVNYGTRNTASVMQAFVSGGCTVTFAAPTADQIDASRFLIQSSFGPSRNDIMSFMTLTPDAAVSGSDHKKRRSTWINNQFNVPRGEKHFQYLMARKVEYDALGQTFYSEMSREAFWKQALKNNDQLRQRLAFALSEVLVVSANGGSSDPFELASYLDLLADNGFGNFKDILTKMALSPAMGRYLSHLRNDGGSSNPNENFAREILQLFAVGLFMLDPDGTQTTTPSYDENTVKGFAKVFTGFTYDDPYCKLNDPGYAVTLANCRDGYTDLHPSWYWAPDRTDLGANFPPVLAGWGRSMVAFPGRHNKLEKQLLKYTTYPGAVSSCSSAITFASGTAILPAIDTTGSGVTTGTRVNATQANATIASAIDNIFCHPNVGPFIAKHLIKFFVTSNPSPAYVQRVANVFNSNGASPAVRGDMRAVMRAILLDDEAVINPISIVPATVASMKVGKLKEPILRLSAILRAFEGTTSSGRYQLHYGLEQVEYGISQSPLQANTVFNYFHPEFTPPGPIATASAVGPEFEITTTTAIASTQNFFGNVVTSSNGNNLYKQDGQGDFSGTCGSGTAAGDQRDCIFSSLSDLYAMHMDTSAIFDYLNLVLLGGSLSTANKAALVTALDTAYAPCATPATAGCTGGTNNANWQNRKRDRIKGALWLAVHTPEFQIQR